MPTLCGEPRSRKSNGVYTYAGLALPAFAMRQPISWAMLGACVGTTACLDVRRGLCAAGAVLRSAAVLGRRVDMAENCAPSALKIQAYSFNAIAPGLAEESCLHLPARTGGAPQRTRHAARRTETEDRGDCHTESDLHPRLARRLPVQHLPPSPNQSQIKQSLRLRRLKSGPTFRHARYLRQHESTTCLDRSCNSDHHRRRCVSRPSASPMGSDCT